MAELRDKNVQQDRQRFRKNMERMGELLAYEVSKTLLFKEVSIETSLGKAGMKIVREYPYLVTVLRAGIPFFQGFLNIFDKSDCGFIGAYRSEHDQQNNFTIEMGYRAIGNINEQEVILIDPMLASGKSITKAIDHLMKFGKPEKLHIASVIASREGYNEVKKSTGLDVNFWIGSMDEKLDENSYIVPGLGDAGDLCFGKKK